MADYPNLTQLKGSKRINLSGIALDRSVGGQPRRRILYSETKHAFEIHHLLNQSDWNTLWSHYESNKSGSFDFVWAPNGEIYLVEYADAPEEIPQGGGWTKAVVRLICV